ncbi:hypothetical protein D8S78_17925 [Natrialba swarupiae]|nr:hypothetical protein [Natrialba swarupiae]
MTGGRVTVDDRRECVRNSILLDRNGNYRYSRPVRPPDTSRKDELTDVETVVTIDAGRTSAIVAQSGNRSITMGSTG